MALWAGLTWGSYSLTTPLSLHWLHVNWQQVGSGRQTECKLHLLAGVVGVWLDDPRTHLAPRQRWLKRWLWRREGWVCAGQSSGSPERGWGTGSSLEVQMGCVGIGQHLTTSLYIHSVLLTVSNQTVMPSEVVCGGCWRSWYLIAPFQTI